MKLPALFALLSAPAMLAAAPAKVTFEDNIRPILKARCFKCHGDDEQKASLNLQHYATVLKGGSSGPALQAGRPNSSLLFQSITHAPDVEPMPPKSDKIPAADIELIRQWIVAGLPENSGSKTREVASLAFTAPTSQKPAKPAMPENLPAFAEVKTAHPHPVTALAASPWAPLLAVAGHGCVKLVHAETGAALGALPFPEGIPFALRFSRDGALLLAAGGKPVQSGKAVLFDVRSGKRLTSIGDENDAVLAADLSADGSLIAIGGPSKTVKVFRTRDGSLAYTLKKHTDWTTALEFSPDGKLLATADRAGGIHLWDAPTGGIALSLSEHKDAITALRWRPDGRLLASASEDGSVILWDMKDGFPAATLTDIHNPKVPGTYGKQPKGVLALAWTAEGNVLTTGRDRTAASWNIEGKLLARHDAIPAIPTAIAQSSGVVLRGDSRGAIHRLPLNGAPTTR